MGHKKELLHCSTFLGALLAISSVAHAEDVQSPSSAQPKAAVAEQSPKAKSPAVAQTTTPGTSTPISMSSEVATSEPMVDETRYTFPNRPLLTTGSTLFVLSYVPTLIYQASEDRNKDLYIPVAGPWMDLAKGDDGRAAKAVLAIDGALQGLGALGIITSLFIPERRTRDWMLIGSRDSRFNLSPARVSQHGYGLFAHGRF